MNKEQKYIKKYIFCMRGAIENCVTEYKTKKKNVTGQKKFFFLRDFFRIFWRKRFRLNRASALLVYELKYKRIHCTYVPK